MTRDDAIKILSNKIKLIRTEMDYTQGKMANILGISKKTLVQIEKGRVTVSWTVAVALCALFENSEIIKETLGDEPLEILRTIAHKSYNTPKIKTLGGKVWWNEVDHKGDFRLQKNILSGHYRILDEDNYRWFSSFDKTEADAALKELIKR